MDERGRMVLQFIHLHSLVLELSCMMCAQESITVPPSRYAHGSVLLPVSPEYRYRYISVVGIRSAVGVAVQPVDAHGPLEVQERSGDVGSRFSSGHWSGSSSTGGPPSHHSPFDAPKMGRVPTGFGDALHLQDAATLPSKYESFWSDRKISRLEIRGTAKGQRRLIDLKPGEMRSVKLEIIYNRDRSQVTDSDQK